MDSMTEQETTAPQLRALELKQAALALLRNSPIAVRAIRSLEGYADEYMQQATARRDEIMTSMFGPDTA
jgi:hypothetical protein